MKFENIIAAVILSAAIVFATVYEKPPSKSERFAAELLASKIATADRETDILRLQMMNNISPRLKEVTSSVMLKSIDED